MTLHTNFRQGQRVLVILTTGKQFVAKYKDSKSGKLFFSDHAYITLDRVRSATIWRHWVSEVAARPAPDWAESTFQAFYKDRQRI